MALLDDPDRQARVVAGVGRSETLATIAADLGTTRQTISRYMAKHPDFKRRVNTARARAVKLGHETRHLTVVEAEIVSDLDALGLPTPAALGRLLWATANDPRARGQGRAQAILAELVYRPLMRQPEQVEDTEPAERRPPMVWLELPRNGSEGPAPGAQQASADGSSHSESTTARAAGLRACSTGRM